MFVWLLHRITGILLLALLLVQLLSGFFQASASQAEWVRALAGLHKHFVLVALLVTAATFHGLYGVRTILLDLGMRRERVLFWACTAVGMAGVVGFLVFSVRRLA